MARFHRLEFFDAARLAGEANRTDGGVDFRHDVRDAGSQHQPALFRDVAGLVLAGTDDSQRMVATACWRGLFFRRGQHLPTMFIGRDRSARNLNDWIAHKEPLGVHRVGVLSDDPPPSDPAALPTPWLGRVADLPRVLVERQVGQVILLELPATDAEARQVIEICQEHGCRLLIHNDLAERYTQPLVPTIEEGRHFYTLQEEPLEDPINRLSSGLTILRSRCRWWCWCCRRCAPGFGSCNACRRRGPLFHVRERRGQRGEVFRMLKFRSMHEVTISGGTARYSHVVRLSKVAVEKATEQGTGKIDGPRSIFRAAGRAAADLRGEIQRQLRAAQCKTEGHATWTDGGKTLTRACTAASSGR